METVLVVAGMTGGLALLLWADLRLFARGGPPSVREAVIWSLGWLALAFAVTAVFAVAEGGQDALEYTTVYLIERSLSLDNVVVFLIIFAYFGVPREHRGRLILLGVLLAVGLRGVAILGGIELIERFEAVLYALGVALLYLAYRVWRGVAEEIDPGNNPAVRLVRRVFPVTDGFRGGRLFRREQGRLHATPLLLVLAGFVFADIVFAIDSIPAAFAITREPLLIWTGNILALLGLRSLFVLVEVLLDRFRYLDESIAIVLAFIAVKLLLEQWVEVGTVPSLAVVGAVFAAGIVLSLVMERRGEDGRAHP